MKLQEFAYESVLFSDEICEHSTDFDLALSVN